MLDCEALKVRSRFKHNYRKVTASGFPDLVPLTARCLDLLLLEKKVDPETCRISTAAYFSHS